MGESEVIAEDLGQYKIRNQKRIRIGSHITELL